MKEKLLHLRLRVRWAATPPEKDIHILSFNRFLPVRINSDFGDNVAGCSLAMSLLYLSKIQKTCPLLLLARAVIFDEFFMKSILPLSISCTIVQTCGEHLHDANTYFS
jgi:hypothetical protein